MKKECIRAMKIEQWNKTVAHRKNEKKRINKLNKLHRNSIDFNSLNEFLTPYIDFN